MAKCKYPNEVCANMIVYQGEAYCTSTPCSLKDGMPKQTNGDRIREMTNEELAEVFEDKVSFFDCEVCSSKYAETDCCEESDCKPFARKWLKEWLKSECDTEC